MAGNKRTLNFIVGKILKSSLSNIDNECKKIKECNGCGGKGGVDFEGLMKALPYFNKGKGKQLFEDLHYLCNWHDIQFTKGGNYLDFIKANYLFSISVYKLIYWTKPIYRIIMFIILFIGTTIKGKEYFNFIKK